MPLPRASPIPPVSTGAPNKYLAMTSFTDNAFPYALWFGCYRTDIRRCADHLATSLQAQGLVELPKIGEVRHVICHA